MLKKTWVNLMSKTRATKTGCMEYTGFKNRQGYGRIGGGMLTHRMAWILVNGEIPTGMCILHRCDNPPCINPNHLWLGTRSQNLEDCARKGRKAIKLRAEYIPEIIKQSKNHGYSLTAKMFGVCPKTVRQIVKNEIWKHVQRGTYA